MTRVGLLRAMLPIQVAVHERVDDADERELHPAERQWISRAVGSRRSEFVTGRSCARAALAELGQDPVALLPDAAGAPQWPDGFVGSITHCTGYRGAAVGRAAELLRSVSTRNRTRHYPRACSNWWRCRRNGGHWISCPMLGSAGRECCSAARNRSTRRGTR